MIGVALANHLWQSTVCVGAAALLAWMLRRYAARVRYRIWLLASLKFLIPFSLLIGLGRHLPALHLAAPPTPMVSVAVRVIGAPFATDLGTDQTDVDAAMTSSDPRRLIWVPLAVWALGSLVLVVSRGVRWRRLAAAARGSRSLQTGREAESLARARDRLPCADRIELRSSSSLLEPGVIGTIRPIILWPTALTARLTDAELDAILVHELSHIRRRDNLAAAVHALLETALWFHPIVWWLGSRLVEERERACDEEVLKVGSERQTYAASILKVCDFCLQSPVSWVAGVTGAYLKTRVEEIMSFERTRSLRRAHRAMLTMMGVLVAAIPVALGATHPIAAIGAPDFAAAGVTRLDIAAIDPPVQLSTGRVTGLVTDQSGGLLVGATVTISGGQRTAVTDTNGRYVMANLEAGQYEISVRLTGFRPSRTPLRIDPGIEVAHDVRLAIGSVSESLTIKGEGTPAARPLQGEALLQNYLDLAKVYWKQGRIVEAEAMMTRASEVIHTDAGTAPVAAVASPAPPPQSGPVRVGGDIQTPKKIRDVKPFYPPDAMAAGVEGIVIMEAIIATDGTVKDVRLLRSVPGLDQAAADAVVQWKFTPTTLNGEPVEVVMNVTVNFTLK